MKRLPNPCVERGFSPASVPADGPNWWIEYVSDTGLTEDRWIKAYETKPLIEGFPVVHHATTTRLLTFTTPKVATPCTCSRSPTPGSA